MFVRRIEEGDRSVRRADECGSRRRDGGCQFGTTNLHENVLNSLEGIRVTDDTSVDIIDSLFDGVGYIVCEHELRVDGYPAGFERFFERLQRFGCLFPELLPSLVGMCLFRNLFVSEKNDGDRREELDERIGNNLPFENRDRENYLGVATIV